MRSWSDPFLHQYHSFGDFNTSKGQQQQQQQHLQHTRLLSAKTYFQSKSNLPFVSSNNIGTSSNIGVVPS